MIEIAKKKKKYSNWSGPKRLILPNLKREKMNPGTYKLLDKNKKPFYTGTSKILQHRLFAVLYGRSDYKQVKGKKKLRDNAKYYQTKYTNIKNARKIEKNSKSYSHKSSKKKKRK